MSSSSLRSTKRSKAKIDAAIEFVKQNISYRLNTFQSFTIKELKQYFTIIKLHNIKLDESLMQKLKKELIAEYEKEVNKAKSIMEDCNKDIEKVKEL